jgi:hypothetical protein
MICKLPDKTKRKTMFNIPALFISICYAAAKEMTKDEIGHVQSYS